MKALGITAMIVAIVSIFMPIIGVYLTIVSAILAAFAAGPGITFAGVALLVNLVNLVFMSPSLWITQASAHSAGGTGPGAYLVAIQVIAAIVLAVVHKAKMKKVAET